MDWRLASIDDGGRTRAALLFGDVVRPLATGVAALLVDWDALVDRLPSLGCEDERQLAHVRLRAPVAAPGAVFCAGANYVDHVHEMLGRPPAPKQGSEPFFFMKPGRQSIVGPDAPVALPHDGVKLDWEAEIAVVIGRRARHVSETDAMNHVAGYVVVDDLSARDLMKRTDVSFTYDWVGQKCFPGALPMGPWLTPRDAVPDPHDLAVRLWVNDVLQQDSSSRQMHWSIPEQIAYLSRRVGLEPGDVVATGTPAGCGSPRGLFLKAGDRIRIEIEALGGFETPIVASEVV